MDFKLRSFSGQYIKKVEFQYLEYGPIERKGKLPLIVFLHGAGERSDDIGALMESPFHEYMKIVPNSAFRAVAPLCHQTLNWTKVLEDLHEFISEYVVGNDIDKKRIYLVGYSMGAFGVWHFSSAYPEIPAAICVISGGADHGFGFPEKAAAMNDIPIYAYHSQFDPVIPVEMLFELKNAVENAGGEMHMKIYPYNYHNIAREVFELENVIEKLLSHRKE